MPWNRFPLGAHLGRCVCAAALASALGCGDRHDSADVAGPAPAPAESLSPTARPGIVASFREDAAAARDPSDGGGHARLTEPDGASAALVAGSIGRFELRYEAGELGIARGGAIYLQVPPFWGWSTPQAVDPDRTGYTTVATEAAGVTLSAATVDRGLLRIEVGGRALVAGETVTMVYGAGPARARVDRYAEHGEQFWLAVDGDGDGVRGLITDPLPLDVAAGPAAALVLTLPSTARPGARVRLTVALLDAVGNAGVAFAGELELEAVAGDVALPAAVVLKPDDRGRRHVTVGPVGAGIVRVRARGARGLVAESNPLVVAAAAEPVLWADLHGHSNLSDGSGSPDDYFTYARDVAALDMVALTDHDHWGMQPLALHPELWQRIRDAAERFHEPGRFVAIAGFEWTSWLHGHRHVLYFDGGGAVIDSIDPAYDAPDELWTELRGKPALTFAHHSAGGPVATNWDYPPDPELEPVTEVVSVHGSSEALDGPGLIYQPVPGNFVRDVLDRGYRLGLIGSGDSHDGHPGLAHIAGASGGLAAVLGAERTREGLLWALRERRVYATNGPRIVLSTTLAGRRMGSAIAAAEVAAGAELTVRAVAVAPVGQVDVVVDGAVAEVVAGDGEREIDVRLRAPALRAGSYLYVRVVQSDGGAAWSSPFFIE